MDTIIKDFLEEVAQVAQDKKVSLEIAYEIWTNHSDNMMEAILATKGIEIYEEVK